MPFGCKKTKDSASKLLELDVSEPTRVNFESNSCVFVSIQAHTKLGPCRILFASTFDFYFQKVHFREKERRISAVVVGEAKLGS